MKKIISEVFELFIEKKELHYIPSKMSKLIWLKSTPWKAEQESDPYGQLYVFKSFSDFEKLEYEVHRIENYVSRYFDDYVTVVDNKNILNHDDFKRIKKLNKIECEKRVDMINKLLRYTQNILEDFLSKEYKSFFNPQKSPPDLYWLATDFERWFAYGLIIIILFFFPYQRNT